MIKNIEIWKDIDGFDNIYQVSNLGKVRSKDRIVVAWNNTKNDYSSKRIKGKILKQSIRNGYYSVTLTKERISCSVHRLLATTFIDNQENKETVNHKDGNKLNNHLSNIEWATYKENTQHAIQTHLKKNSYNDKKVFMNTLDGEKIREFESLTKAAIFLGDSNKKKHICSVCKGKRNTAYGYKWNYTTL